MLGLCWTQNDLGNVPFSVFQECLYKIGIISFMNVFLNLPVKASANFILEKIFYDELNFYIKGYLDILFLFVSILESCIFQEFSFK